MATISDSQTTVWTASEVLARFGDIPIVRIRTTPPPGEATEADVIELHDHHDRLCELIDGTLVEKTIGWQESRLAVWIGAILCNFVEPRNLGMVFGSDGCSDERRSKFAFQTSHSLRRIALPAAN
jgi:hypothetical protein